MSTEKYIIFVQLVIIVLLWVQFQIPNSKIIQRLQNESPNTLNSRSIHKEDSNPPYRTDIYIWPYPKEYILRGTVTKYQIVNWKGTFHFF